MRGTVAKAKRKKKTILDDPRYWEFCQRYHNNFTRFVCENSTQQVSWQQFLIMEEISKPGCKVAIASGHGCFGKGTPVLLASGHVVPVEDVKQGDLLMGDDSTVRNVLELKRGREAMYRFTYSDGTGHIFNESHILCLVATQTHGRQCTGDKITVTVREWLKWSDRKKKTHAMYRAPAEFRMRHSQPMLIEPYVLGLWLGDGTATTAEFTTADREIVNELREYAEREGYELRKRASGTYNYYLTNNRTKKGGFHEKLTYYGLIGNKHIPLRYKTASREERLQLLAGVVDTDGTLDQRNKRCISIFQKSESLAEDIAYIARSVGIHATINPVTKTCHNNGKSGSYFAIHLSRNVEAIPARLERKRPDATGTIQRPNLHFGIAQVEPLGEGDYYGFELDGNHKFLGGDFTVLHNTGKSWLMGWYCYWHLCVVNPFYAFRALHGKLNPNIFSQMLLTANNVDQCRTGVWKYVGAAMAQVENNFPWLAGHFIKEVKKLYNKDFKDEWYVMPKTASKHKPEGVAGQHAEQYCVLIDEASGVEDVIHDVLEGALTQANNRHIMISQPTRTVGRFAEAFGSLKALYKTFNLNAEESPLVTKKWVGEMLVKYGGHHSPEYQIKVLGRLPDNLSGYLIPKSWLEQAQTLRVLTQPEYNQLTEEAKRKGLFAVHKDSWGWVATVDVAEGVHRDSSVYTLWKVSGYGPERVAEVVKQVETLEMDELKFAREMWADIGALPNITFGVDGDGPGRTVILFLEEMGANVERIHWGLPPHTDADKKRYKNQRAFASVKTREAIFSNRRHLPPGKKVVEQGCKIPYKIDEAGRYVIMPKDQMKNEGIKSPDLFDTICFIELVDYIPAGDVISDEQNDLIQEAIRLLQGDDVKDKKEAA